MENILTKANSIHFIGIGGIGISAIARMLLLEGKKVSGSDRGESEVTKELERAGAKIYMGQKAENIPNDCDLIIYTVAVPADNPELLSAKARGTPMLTYPETLNIISKEKYTIAISGTHGKTTTTAMVAGILIEAGLDPTVLVGSLMKDPRTLTNHPPAPSLSKEGETGGGHRGTNFIAGSSKYFVVEADEYKKSFHNLYPSILVINNIDEDHLDFYKDLADIQASFRELAERVPPNGFVIANLENPHVDAVITDIPAKVIDYNQNRSIDFKLEVPGEHNRSNAAAAYTVGMALGISPSTALGALNKFRGTWRRFEYKGETERGAKVYDDYAHNPKKVQAAIQGAREMYPDKNLVVIFQPHLYSRTKLLLREFAVSFNEADLILLAPIYAARENFDPTISSERLAEAISKQGIRARAFSGLEEIRKYVSAAFGKNDVIVVMGAGDITTVADSLIHKNQKQ